MQRWLRILLCLAVLIAGGGCARPAASGAGAEAAAAFGSAQTLAPGDRIRYVDGLELGLEAIEDSRCPPDAQCIWQGELAPRLQLRGGSLGTAGQILVLGTERTREGRLGRYRLVLEAATPDTATLRVSRE